MVCTTCGNSNSSGNVSNIDTSALNTCGCTNNCSCPDINVMNCEELKNLNEVLVNRNCTNAEHIDTCNTKSVAWYLAKVLENQDCLNEKLIAALCGLMEKISKIENILIKNGYVTVTEIYSYTVPVEKFVPTSGGNVMQWSGSPDAGECFIEIPISSMDIVDTVIAQPQVVGEKVHAVTVAIQSATLVGDKYRVNFDTYEIQGNSFPGNDIPYSVPIKFVVFGRKKF